MLGAMRRSQTPQLVELCIGSWMTDVSEKIDHLVTEETLCNIPASGYAHAVCGDHFLPASLTAPPGRLCRLCRSVVDEQQTDSRETSSSPHTALDSGRVHGEVARIVG